MPDSEYPDHQICDKSLSDLRRLAKADKPFFLACGFYPTTPAICGTQEVLGPLSRGPGDSCQTTCSFHTICPKSSITRGARCGRIAGFRPKGPVTDETARQLIRGYRACVSFVDVQVGRLLDELDRLQIADNTIVVLWGDHGWQLGEHGFWCKHTNFEVATRTPLLIVAPGLEGRRVSQRLVEYVDIYPTLCDLAGLPLPKHLQGQSMRPLLSDVDAEFKDLVVTRFGGGDAVRTADYRYMEMHADGGSGALRGVGLFDLRNDADENQNVAEDPAYAQMRSELAAKLKAALQAAQEY